MTVLTKFNIGYKIIPITILWISTLLFISFLVTSLTAGLTIPLDGFIIGLSIFTFAAIYGIGALSLNLETGLTGLPNFGKVAFIMIGAYVTAFFMLLRWPFYLAIPLAIIVTAFVGYLIALPTLGLRDDYLAIVTIAIGEIFRTILLAEEWIGGELDCNACGGAQGLRIPNVFFEAFPYPIVVPTINIPNPIGFIFGPAEFIFGGLLTPAFLADITFFLFVTMMLILTYMFVELLYNSPWGRILKSIRDNDLATESLGKDVVDYRIRTFIISSGIAGLCGALFAIFILDFTPFIFVPLLTFQIWIIMIIGGVANNRGMLIGAIIFFSITNLTRAFNDQISGFLATIASVLNPIQDLPFIPAIQHMITLDPVNAQWIGFGLLILLFLMFRPEGIIPERPIKTVANEVMPPIPTD